MTTPTTWTYHQYKPYVLFSCIKYDYLAHACHMWIKYYICEKYKMIVNLN